MQIATKWKVVMNPKYYYYVFMGSMALLGRAADMQVNTEKSDLTANVQITANTEAGKTAIKSSLNSPNTKIQIISDGDSVPSGVEVKHVKISPGKKIIISVDPCDSSEPSDELTVIPQTIEPAISPAKLSASEQALADQLEKKNSIYDVMNSVDLEEHVRKVIEFFDLVKQAGNQRLSKKLTKPQIALIGESDELKRALIEKLTGIKSVESQDSIGSQDDHVVTYSMPVRFKLIKNSNYSTAPLVKVNNKEETGNLFKILDEIKSTELVEVEIQSANVSSLIFIDLPAKMPFDVKGKYLEHFWSLSVVVGSTENSFEEWESLKLVRSFDGALERNFTVAMLHSRKPSEKEANRIKAVALGLQQGFASMTREKMFYTAVDATAPVCAVASCGEAQLMSQLHRKFLKIWSFLRPAAVKIIQRELVDFESRIRGHEEFQTRPDDEKWKALIGQIGSVLNDQLMFLPEEKDNCAPDSVLDTIKESIFSEKAAIEDQPIPNFRDLFANYQMKISQISPIPAGVDEAAITVAIEDLRSNGPKQKTIFELENILFTSQFESLKTVKAEFLEKIEATWKARVQQALNSKFALEPYDALKNHIMGASEKILQGQLKEIARVNDEIDAVDLTSKWTFNFFNSKSNANIWIELMKADTTAAAIDAFYANAREGFTVICNTQAALQVRLVIEKLLTRKILHLVLTEAPGDKTKLTEMSQEAGEKIKRTKELIAKLKEAIEKA